MSYFWIEYGLRGAYCDGNGYIVRADTRRALKSVIASEADSLRDAGLIGANKRAVGWLAAAAWKARRGGSPYPHVMPISGDNGASYAWGVHCAPSSRAEYMAQDDGGF